MINQEHQASFQVYRWISRPRRFLHSVAFLLFAPMECIFLIIVLPRRLVQLWLWGYGLSGLEFGSWYCGYLSRGWNC
jgi:hypothetical protein